MSLAQSRAKLGELNPRWNNGVSQYPNHYELKKKRIEVLKRSFGKCEICGELAKIVHHVDGSKDNHSLDNLIALCKNCHIPLHNEDNNGQSINGRPTKYGLIYGFTLKQIAVKFNVTIASVYGWVNNPEKKIWLEEQLSKQSNQLVLNTVSL